MIVRRIVVLFVVACFFSRGVDAQSAQEALGECAAGGVCLYIGADQPQFAFDLASSGNMVVHALCVSADNTENIRERALQNSNYGKVAALHVADIAKLPYVSGIGNLVVADLDKYGSHGLTKDELVRVTAYSGTLYLKENGSWTTESRPIPSSVATWPHFRHDPALSAHAPDSLAGHPKVLTWIGGSVEDASVLLADHGVVLVHDENQGRKTDIAVEVRDAFNGIVLWKKNLKMYQYKDHYPTFGFSSRTPMPANVRRVFTIGHGRLYGALDPKPLAMDLRTGEILTEFDCDGRVYQISYSGERIVMFAFEGVYGYAPSETAPSWTYSGQPMDPVIENGRVTFVDYASPPGKLVCLDATSGSKLWERALQEGEHIAHATDGLVTTREMESGKVKAYHTVGAEKGNVAWEWQGGEVYDIPNMMHSGQYQWVHDRSRKSIVALDALTGTERKSIDIINANISCQWSVAMTNNLAVCDISWVDIAAEEQNFTHKVWWSLDEPHIGTNDCVSQLIVAYGLTYLGPKSCYCPGMGGSIRAGYPLELETDPTITHLTSEYPRVQGTVNASSVMTDESYADEWPTFLGNARRFASAGSGLSLSGMKKIWSIGVPVAVTSDWTTNMSVGDRISAPTTAGGLVYVADMEGGRILAYNAATTDPEWTYQAGGRIDAPPTIYKGLCLFGSHDGHLYCLSASDGQLVWKTRLAPGDRLVPAYERIESYWPVIGAVTATGNTACAMTGRYFTFAGGAFVYGVDLTNGEVKWAQQDTINGNTTALDADGKVYPTQQFGLQGAKSVKMPQVARDPSTGTHAASLNKGDFLQYDAFPHNWREKYPMNEWPFTMLYNEDKAFLFDAEKVTMHDASSITQNYKELGNLRKDPLLSYRPSGSVTAVVAVGTGQLIVGGSDSQGKGFVHIVSTSDASVLAEFDIPSAPVYQGIAVSQDAVIVSGKNGTMHKLGRGTVVGATGPFPRGTRVRPTLQFFGKSITASVGTGAPALFYLMDSRGRVSQKRTFTGTLKINTSVLRSAGIYTLVVEAGGKRISHRILNIR